MTRPGEKNLFAILNTAHFTRHELLVQTRLTNVFIRILAHSFVYLI